MRSNDAGIGPKLFVVSTLPDGICMVKTTYQVDHTQSQQRDRLRR
jgi:hypothetical protein